MRFRNRSLRKNKRAVSPAISTVIITGTIVTLLLVTIVFANGFLNGRIAENEFSANRQFMLTTGLQIDDIAWTIGRTQTVRYSSKFGNMKFESATLNCLVEVNGTGTGGVWQPLFPNGTVTGMILFNMPVSTYTLGNNYFERLSPSSNGSFLQQGPSAPVSHVFCVEKLPMAEGNYTRIVAVPSIRMLTSTITGPQGTLTNYIKFYLPALEPGNHSYRSQSITLTGNDIIKVVKSGVNQVRITVTFLDAGSGFNSDFFNFDSTTITLNNSTVPRITPNSVVEFYVGKVKVTLGQV